MDNLLKNKEVKTTPLITIITVVFNDAINLKKTIDSIICQTSDDIEYVIIDGGSTDGTLKVIQDHNENIDYWQSESDKGTYDAMNKGIKASTGKYLLFLNAGDCFTGKNVVNCLVKDIRKNYEPDILYGSTNILSENGDKIKELAPLRFSSINLTLFGTRTVCHQSIITKKTITSYFDIDYKIKGDLAWYYDILKNVTRPHVVRVDYAISSYLLGGISDNQIVNNIKERIRVVFNKKGLVWLVISLPTMLLPVLFRIKKLVTNK